MGYILSLLLKLDAAIQKRFDSICFFLMRRFGVRKSMIRYALSAIGIICLASSMFLGAYATASFVTGLVMAFLAYKGIFPLILMQHEAMREDQIAERTPGTRSKADAITNGALKLFWSAEACIAVSLFVNLIPISSFAILTEMRVREAKMVLVGLVVFLLARLALEYLKKTPMNPPAEKARERVGTPQSAPART